MITASAQDGPPPLPWGEGGGERLRTNDRAHTQFPWERAPEASHSPIGRRRACLPERRREEAA
jgi:hypothetical protein